MARPQAVAVGLYYPTPIHLASDIAGLVRVESLPPGVPNACGYTPDTSRTLVVADPCAGEGIALAALCTALKRVRVDVSAYACELEATRFAQAKRRLEHVFPGAQAHGDAFRLRAPPSPGAGVLLLNPPYNDQERATLGGRLEARFLRRQASLLAPGGILLLLVPHYSLDEAVDPLAWEFEDVRCFRFPDADFPTFKQVLVVARKRPRLLRSNIKVVGDVLMWADDAGSCEPWNAVGLAAGAYEAPTLDRGQKPFEAWEVVPVDLAALVAETGPWRRTTRTGRSEVITSVMPAAGGLALLRRRFPVVTPLKPAYVAAAVACGLFDGEVVRPDAPASGLPDVLVRGVFTRDFVTIDEKVGPDGDVVGEIQAQAPRLDVTALDLSTGEYHALAPSAERTGAKALGAMTAADFLAAYGRDLLAVMGRNCPVLHDPARDEAFELPALARPLYPAQADVVRAALALTHPRFAARRAAWLSGIGDDDEDARAERSDHGPVDGRGSENPSARAIPRLRRTKRVHDRPRDGHRGRDSETQDGARRVGDDGGRVLGRGGEARDPGAEPHRASELAGRDQRVDPTGRRGIARVGRPATVQGPADGDLQGDPLTNGVGSGHERRRPGAARGLDRPPIPLIPAEVGSGKSSIALTVAAGHDARTILVLCPPHLVDRSWPDEVRKVYGPDAETHELDSVESVDRFAATVRAGPDKRRVAVVSREAAKLKYARASVSGWCPGCGAVVAPGDHAGKRARCGAPLPRAPAVDDRGRWCPRARLVLDAALALAPVYPENPGLAQYLDGRGVDRWRARLVLRATKATDGERFVRSEAARATMCSLAVRALGLSGNVGARVALGFALAGGDATLLAEAIVDGLSRPVGWEAESALRHAVALLPEDVRAGVRPWIKSEGLYASGPDEQTIRDLLEKGGELGPLRVDGGVVTYNKRRFGSLVPALGAIDLLAPTARWAPDRTCREPLWQADTRLGRRVALADWILRRHPRLFDFFIRDESQEHSDADAAQTIASTKLMRRIGRGVDLSGSACSGYAESLFAATHARDPRFRERFKRGDEREFVRQYGYVKRLVEDRDAETRRPITFGASSDRVERSERVIGMAPGVLPIFLLDHLLRGAVPLHKSDLALDLAPHAEEQVRVDLGPDLDATFKRLAREVRERIKEDRFEEGRAGKLYGALAELVSFPDLCTDDVTPGGAYEVRYPPEVEKGRKLTAKERRELGRGELVCSAPTLPASAILPKERAMLDRVAEELNRDNRVLVFVRHVALMPRIQRLIQRELGDACAVLYASKPEGLVEAHGSGRINEGCERDIGRGAGRVDGHHRVGSGSGSGSGAGRSTPQRDRGKGRGAGQSHRVVGAHERQAWIEGEVIAKKVRVLVVNPVAVKTGLNVLTYFNRAWWHENPGCDAVTCRQANGRIDRIGKTRDTLALYATAGDLQERAHRLWMHKVAVSLAADGLDAGSAMALAGLGDGHALDAMSVGRQLFAMLEREG